MEALELTVVQRVEAEEAAAAREPLAQMEGQKAPQAMAATLIYKVQLKAIR